MLAACVGTCAILIAVSLLYWFHAVAWYWHLLAIVASFGFGFAPVPEAWHSPVTDLATLFVFLLPFVWGVGGFIVYRRQHPRHA